MADPTQDPTVLPTVTVKAPTLINTVASVYASSGQDVSDPVVQQKIGQMVQTLKSTGQTDGAIINHIQENLPDIINEITAKRAPPAVNPTGQQDLASQYGQQAQLDAQKAQRATMSLPLRNLGGQPVDNVGNKNFVDSAYIPSNALKASMDAQSTARASDLSAIGTQAENANKIETANQAGITTSNQRRNQAMNIMAGDPQSPISINTVNQYQAALKAAGAPQTVIDSMSGLSAEQANKIAENYKSSLGVGQAQADLTSKFADIHNKNATTAGLILDNQIKQFGVNATKSGPTGTNLSQVPQVQGMPGMSPENKQKFDTNSTALKELQSGANDRAQTKTLIDQTLALVNESTGFGPGNTYIPFNSSNQELTKNLATLGAAQTKNQSTVVGASFAGAAVPDITKNKSTIINFLFNLKSQIERQDALAKDMQNFKGGLENYDIQSQTGKTRSYVKPDGNPKVVTFGPTDPISSDDYVKSKGYQPLVGGK
jgi:hypothetical protein